MENTDNRKKRTEKMMYLPKSLWSPRYETNFFTIEIQSKRKVLSIIDTVYVDNNNHNNNNSNNDESNNCTTTTATTTTIMTNDEITTTATNTNNLVEINDALFSSQLFRVNNNIIGNTSFPAYYYEIIIYQQHTKRILYRRYSQFQWLHNQLTNNTSTSSHLPLPESSNTITNSKPKIPNLPFGLFSSLSDSTNSSSNSSLSSSQCFLSPNTFLRLFGQNNEFAQNRLQQLSKYLSDVLSLPDYANHPAMISFLELG